MEPVDKYWIGVIILLQVALGVWNYHLSDQIQDNTATTKINSAKVEVLRAEAAERTKNIRTLLDLARKGPCGMMK